MNKESLVPNEEYLLTQQGMDYVRSFEGRIYGCKDLSLLQQKVRYLSHLTYGSRDFVTCSVQITVGDNKIDFWVPFRLLAEIPKDNLSALHVLPELD